VRSTDWDHNGWYHRLLLAQVPLGAVHVLDVGCGAGTLARRLAARTSHVDALDRSPAMLAAAAEAAPPNLTLHLADLRTADLPAAHYDAAVSSAVLHHLSLADALPRMARWVRPGGVLAAVALPRVNLPGELGSSWQRRWRTPRWAWPWPRCGRSPGRTCSAGGHPRRHAGGRARPHRPGGPRRRRPPPAGCPGAAAAVLAVPAALAQAARRVFSPDPDRARAPTRSAGDGTAHQRTPSGSPARAAARRHCARCGR
jgi:SAM-dependent methyltransferase